MLWRDAEIAHLKSLVAGQPEHPLSKARLERRLDRIRPDFRFIAECNSGETFMCEERIRRVEEIAAQTGVRHLDDRIGLSHDELERTIGAKVGWI